MCMIAASERTHI